MSDRDDTLDWVRDCPSEAVALIGRLEQENADLRARVAQLELCYEKVCLSMTVRERYSTIGQAIVDTYPHQSPSDYRRQLVDETIEKVASRLEQVQEYKAANEIRKLKGKL